MGWDAKVESMVKSVFWVRAQGTKHPVKAAASSLTNSRRGVLTSLNNTLWDNERDGNQQLVLRGLYMVGEEENGTVA